MGKEFYSLKDYLTEGRLLVTDEPTMIIRYGEILGAVKVLECGLAGKAYGDLDPFLKALKEVEENGSDEAKASLRFVDHIGAYKRATNQGKKFRDFSYIYSKEGQKDFHTLEQYGKMIAEQDSHDEETIESKSIAVMAKRMRQWADEFTERAATDLKTAEEYEKSGNSAAAHEMREEARKKYEIAEEMQLHLENGTLFNEE